MLWLAAALIFTAPPMFGNLVAWVPVLFLLALALKFWMEPRGARLRSLPAKIALATITAGAVGFHYGSLKGIEPGVSLLVVLMSLKILEAHTARDFQVMVMVAWVLCLCGFVMSQELTTALCLLIAFTLLVAALVEFHRGAAPRQVAPPLRTAAKLLAQATPLIALLFLFFPRTTTGFRSPLADSGSSSGFSGRLSPGSVVGLARSTDLAFRAEFPEGNMPRPANLYWRGAVLWEGNGFEWRAADFPAALPRDLQRRPEGGSILQRITIEPHRGRWLFALDFPASAPPGATLAPGHYLWSGSPVRKARRYDVRSYRSLPDRDLSPRERKLALDLPADLHPAVRAIAAGWMREHSDPRMIVRAALEFFRTGGFVYSLAPGEYQPGALAEFLFERRTGFCEHYAAAFATLMRAAGIPARVVVGYQGGEWNGYGRFLMVRQADAHAWCEVWLPEAGWSRVDPTSVVAPSRVNLGLDAFLARRAANPDADPDALSGASAGPAGDVALLRNVRLAWDSVNYAWDTRLLAFDAEMQLTFLRNLQLDGLAPPALLLATAAAALFVLVLYAVTMRLRARPAEDPVRALYERFCRKAARAGAPRQPTEGPGDFAARLADCVPSEAARIARIVRTYIALRYAPHSSAGAIDQLAAEVKAFAPGRPR